MTDMITDTSRYERNIPALSEEECRLLHTKKILIAGCGGLGGYLAEFMARIGIGTICVVDGDVFEPSNLNRQLLSSPDQIGYAKAEAAAGRISLINPSVQITWIQDWITEANASELISGYDVILDALDNIPARKILTKACTKARIPFIYGAIRGWTAQAAVVMPGEPLLDILYPENVVLSDKSVLSFTPAMCASIQSSLCIRLLTGRPVESGQLYYYDLLHQEFETLSLC